MCLSLISRILLVAVNIAVGLLGFGLVMAGAMVLLADKIAGGQMGDLLEKVGSIAESIGISDTEDSEVDTDQLVKDVVAFANDGAISLIIIGAIILAFAILGCCGGCCKSKIGLIVFGVIALALGLILAVNVGLFFEGDFNDEIKDTFQKMVDDKYEGIDSYLPESMLINYLQIRYECCGIDNYKDYNTAENWKRKRTYEVNGIETERILVTPVACCLMEGDFPDVEPKDNNCATHPTELTSNFQKGCWKAVNEELSTYKQPIQAISILLIIFIFILAIAALHLFIDEMCCTSKVSPV